VPKQPISLSFGRYRRHAVRREAQEIMTVETSNNAVEIRKERIKMQDGRYLIYYTFPGLGSTLKDRDDAQGDNDPGRNDVHDDQ
jgi:hypothetical protein